MLGKYSFIISGLLPSNWAANSSPHLKISATLRPNFILTRKNGLITVTGSMLNIPPQRRQLRDTLILDVWSKLSGKIFWPIKIPIKKKDTELLLLSVNNIRTLRASLINKWRRVALICALSALFASQINEAKKIGSVSRIFLFLFVLNKCWL